MMLVHVGLSEHAEKVHNAWLRAIEDGIHTYDIYDEKSASRKSGRTSLRRPLSNGRTDAADPKAAEVQSRRR
jgi:hypothetical protein